MFNIDEALNEIIYKYELDDICPSYRRAIKCENVLKKCVDNHCLLKEKVLFVCGDNNEVDIISHIAQGNMLIKCILYKNINENILWSEYKKIYVASYEINKDILNILIKEQVHYIWIYDVFSKNNCGCDRDFYKLNLTDSTIVFPNVFAGRKGWRNSIQLEFYNSKKKYRELRDEKEKERELRKCLFYSLYMKDFKKSDYYFNILSRKDIRFKKAYDEVKALLGEIKKKVKGNSYNNIVIYLMDAISYEESKDMQYLHKQMKKSVVFENAYATMGNTFPTIKNMLLGKYMFEDRTYAIKKINTEDSEVLKFLQEYGYDIKFISGYMNWVDYRYRSAKRHEIYDSCSMILWDLMNNLINQDKKTFYVVHMLVESHEPYLSSRMSKKSIMDESIRSEFGRKVIDEQLEFYDKFLNDKSYRIYMSDHGKGALFEKYHIILSLYHKKIVNKRINELYSIIDFEKLIKQILVNCNIDERELKREYVHIQNLDKYNYSLIKDIFVNKKYPNIFFMGFNGVITRNKMYVRFKNGQECLIQNDMNDKKKLLWNECVEIDDEIDLLRGFTWKYPEEIVNDDMFKYSKYVDKLIEKLGSYMKRYINIICSKLDKYPLKSVAIRMGGEHSMNLYARLSDEYKDKIACFIDGNKMCVCAKYGLPVISIDELEKGNIQAVILSSYDHRAMLRSEAEKYSKDIDVIDIYSVLEDNDILCTNNFYMNIKLKDEDYDVGFPFGKQD